MPARAFIRFPALLTLVVLLAAAGAAIAPLPAAAADQVRINFTLTINGPSPTADTFRFFIQDSPRVPQGQFLRWCAPHATWTRTEGPILPCEGGGRLYGGSFGMPAGTKGSFRFERVAADGTVTILRQGSFIAPLTDALHESDVPTFSVTYNVTLPNTATAPTPEASASSSLVLGILLVLGAMVLTWSAGVRRSARLAR